MKKRHARGIDLVVSSCLLAFLLSPRVQGRPTTPQEALLAVSGWLVDNAEPLNVPLGNLAVDVETVTGEADAPLYYLVHLQPNGFVVVPADDLVEPILSFTDGAPSEPNAPDPLSVLIAADVNRRLMDAYGAGSAGGLHVQLATRTQQRWGDLIDKAGRRDGDLGILGLQAVSDVRVAPFLKTCWAQGDVCWGHCYNYFTPANNPCGCAATAMAQVMYYYRWPASGVGRNPFTIEVFDRGQSAITRGGNGIGGPYRWADMVLVPDCDTTVEQRQAVGALCYDAGVSLGTNYAPEGSGADAFQIVPAFKNVFGYGNSVSGANNGRDIGAGLADMINPNLDAEYPVILGILGLGGHAVVVDGYGYDLSTSARTLYHHLNMGWAGYNDIWYNLPDVGDYDTISVCIYNIFPNGTGEIISGRITDAAGQPLGGVAVRADLRTMHYEAVTNARGIYALTHLPSAGSFTLQADKPGYSFAKQTVNTGTSRDRQPRAGNRWGIDFVGTRTAIGPLAGGQQAQSVLPTQGTRPEPTPAEN